MKSIVVHNEYQVNDLMTHSLSHSIGVTVLGSTGSIGVNTLDVLAQHPEHYHVVGLSAHTRVEKLYQQCLQLCPLYAVMTQESDAKDLARRLKQAGLKTEVLVGEPGLLHMVSDHRTHYVMAAIVGAAGLTSTLAAARAGKRILLANKESLVMAGALFMETVWRNGAELLPIDSEHNAIFQSLPRGAMRAESSLQQSGVRKILLTASGGPFLHTPMEQLRSVTVEQACAHPKWRMGRKISVDSATMMNKGLEVIEACWLFSAKPAQVQVVIHPESIIHSMVDYIDGSVLAQLGAPDMRTPIAYGLAWPNRISSGVSALDLFNQRQLNFLPPDFERFPCLKLAYDAINTGGSAPAALNAANEVAVAAFLEGRIRFDQIATVTAQVLDRHHGVSPSTIEHILAIDEEARIAANQIISAWS